MYVASVVTYLLDYSSFTGYQSFCQNNNAVSVFQISDLNCSFLSSGCEMTPTTRTTHLIQDTNKPSTSSCLHSGYKLNHTNLFLQVLRAFAVTVNGSQWAPSSPNSLQRNLLNNSYGGWLVISSVKGHELMSKALKNLQMTNHPMQELFAFVGIKHPGPAETY